MILPSLLEYSKEGLQNKLNLLSKNQGFVRKLQNSNRLSLHLDFVLPQFAKDRSVMTSLKLGDVFDTLYANLKHKKLTLSIHLMGETEDLIEAYKYFHGYDFNPNWKYILLLPEKYLNSWRQLIKESGKNVVVGCWYDLNQWDQIDFKKKQTNLLMTVCAGKSGQKLTETIKENAVLKSVFYPQSHFIFDGGWDVNNAIETSADFVSYTSFWAMIQKLK